MVEVRVAMLPVTPSNPHEKCVLSIAKTPGFVSLQVVFPGGGTFLPGNTRVLLNLKIQLPLSHYGLLGQETSRQGEESPSNSRK